MQTEQRKPNKDLDRSLCKHQSRSPLKKTKNTIHENTLLCVYRHLWKRKFQTWENSKEWTESSSASSHRRRQPPQWDCPVLFAAFSVFASARHRLVTSAHPLWVLRHWRDSSTFARLVLWSVARMRFYGRAGAKKGLWRFSGVGAVRFLVAVFHLQLERAFLYLQ